MQEDQQHSEVNKVINALNNTVIIERLINNLPERAAVEPVHGFGEFRVPQERRQELEQVHQQLRVHRPPLNDQLDIASDLGCNKLSKGINYVLTFC